MNPSAFDPPASWRIPTETLLAILAHCSPSTLAAFAQTSFAFLEVASPLLYNSVTLSSPAEAALFFSPPRVSPSHLPRIEPYIARSQTKLLVANYDKRDRKQHPLFTPHTGPLLLDSYSDQSTLDCHNHVGPRVHVPVRSGWPLPTLLGRVREDSPTLFKRGRPGWSRLEDLVFPGYFPSSLPYEWGKEETDYRFTMDLSMIEQKVDPRNPKGSSQRVLEGFAKNLNGSIGRVWVGSEETREMFEVAKEEAVKRLDGSRLGKEVGDIKIEIKEPSYASAAYV